jgi:lysophospholipase L1-like esterase
LGQANPDLRFTNLAKSGLLVSEIREQPKESHQVGLTRIITKANNMLQRLADQYEVIYIDSWSMSALSDQEDWSRDGVHLNSRGYFKFARDTIQVLEQRKSIRLGVIEA